MQYDALTLAAIADELANGLVGGRVQKVVQPSPLSIGMEIYAGSRTPLLLSAENASPGVLLTELKQRRGVEVPSPLQLLLAKYLRHSRLVAVHQPMLERVLWLDFSGALGQVSLVCEIMGRLSNLILVGADGLIMDSAKRVTPAINRYRTIVPRQRYVPPPAQRKEDPLALTLPRLQAVLGQPEGLPVWRRLVDGVSAISPTLAREILYRAFGTVDPPDPMAEGIPERVFGVLQQLIHLPGAHAWAPSVGYEEDDEGRRPTAFAPYELTHYPDHELVRSTEGDAMSLAIRRVMESSRSLDPYKSARARLGGLLEAQLARQRAKLAALHKAVAPPGEIEALRMRAEAILARAWEIGPGQTELVLPASEAGQEGGQPCHIALDPSLTPAQNAQSLFRDYRKMQAAAAGVPAILAKTELEMAYLQQLQTEVGLAGNRPALDEVERAMVEAGYLGQQERRRALGKSELLILRSPDDMLILVGRSSRQNDEVTFHSAGPDDLWLHAHGVPGAHVVIKSGGRQPGEETLRLAARLAARYSSARAQHRVQVDWTPRRYVRHIRGARPGMVTFTHEQSLVVEPEAEDPEEYF